MSLVDWLDELTALSSITVGGFPPTIQKVVILKTKEI
jgi:hypothetical protein